MIHFELANYLTSITAINDVIEGRIYNNRAPQTTSKNKLQPRIVYRLLPGSTRHYHSTGASGLVEADIALQFVGPTSEEAGELYELVRDEIDGFKGIWNETVIDRATLTPPADGSGDPTQGDDVGYPCIAANVEVFYQETVPALGGP